MAAKYPVSVVTHEELLIAVNNRYTGLDGSLSAVGDNTGGLGIAVDSTAGFPPSGVISIDAEVIAYTSITGNKFVGITRAYDGTTAAIHADNEKVSQFIVAKFHETLRDEIIAAEGDLKAAQGVLADNIVPAASAATLKARMDQIVSQIRAIANPAASWFAGVLINVANGLVRLDSLTRLPAVDGSQLTGIGLNGTFRDKEIPTGVIDGVNTQFFLTFAPIVGSDHVYVNGILQLEGYSLVGTTITFEPSATPQPLSKLRVSYRR